MNKNISSFAIAAIAKVERKLRLPRGLTTSKTTSLLDGSFEPDLVFRILDKMAPEVFFDVKGRFPDYNIIHYFAERFHVEIDDCFIDAKNSILYDLQGSIVEESTPWSKDHLANTSVPNPRNAAKYLNNYVNKKSAILSSNGYYHWLIEDLPNYLMVRSIWPDLNTLVARSKPKYVQNFIDYENIDVKEIDRFSRVGNVNFISRGDDTGWPHPKDIEILRNHFSANFLNTEKDKKIYISREKSTRSPKFEADLVKELKQKGWVILYLENLDLLEQIREISSASLICGVHGAGLANMVWMKPCTQVIEISGSEYRTCFRNLAKVSNLKYNRIEADLNSFNFEYQRILTCLSN